MATIYDVAKLAGTSISTVSNYLNQSKYVGPDKAQSVKDAIEALGYIPNRAAKALKTQKSMEIHVILPNLKDPLYTNTYTGISNHLMATDYSLTLHLTQDIKAHESIIIEKVIKSNPAGVLICTCLPDHSDLLKRLDQHCHTIFLFRSVALNCDLATYEFDNHRSVYSLTKVLLNHDYKSIHLITGPDDYSYERQCRQGFQSAKAQHLGQEIDRLQDQTSQNHSQEAIHQIPLSRERAFRQLALQFANKPLPEAIIASSSLFTTAVEDLYALRGQNDYLLITLGYESWYNKDLSRTILQTIRQSEDLGAKAIEALLRAINSPSTYEKKVTLFQDDFDYEILEHKISTPTATAPTNTSQSPNKELKLLLLDDPLSVNALKILLPTFEFTYKVKVTIETKSYSDLYETILQRAKPSHDTFDLCSVDLPWIADFAQDQIIAPLTQANTPQFLDATKAYMLNQNGGYDYPFRLGLHNFKLYGIPYIIGLQLLFYRKDLFQDQSLKESFYNIHNRELAPPTDWFTFNQVAKFFSKSYNQDSPTTYGTALANHSGDTLLGEILPRVWGYSGQLIDQDMNTHFASPPVKQAFENYIESTNYNSKSTPRYAQDVAETFSKGDVAMITSYINYAPILYDPVTSQTNGLVDFTPMPSDSSMVSGWSLCMNASTSSSKEVEQFLEWFLSLDVAYRYSMITGNPTRHQLYHNTNLNQLYPWLSTAMDTFEKGHTRLLFTGDLDHKRPRKALEATVEEIIRKKYSSKSSLHSLLKQGDRDFMS